VDSVYDPGDNAKLLAEAAWLESQGIQVTYRCDQCDNPAVMTAAGFRHADAADMVICSIMFPR
jgi:hypothetical protein